MSLGSPENCNSVLKSDRFKMGRAGDDTAAGDVGTVADNGKEGENDSEDVIDDVFRIYS
jgi:hypothetical protein